jgi:hypothetical protein
LFFPLTLKSIIVICLYYLFNHYILLFAINQWETQKVKKWKHKKFINIKKEVYTSIKPHKNNSNFTKINIVISFSSKVITSFRKGYI